MTGLICSPTPAHCHCLGLCTGDCWGFCYVGWLWGMALDTLSLWDCHPVTFSPLARFTLLSYDIGSITGLFPTDLIHGKPTGTPSPWRLWWIQEQKINIEIVLAVFGSLSFHVVCLNACKRSGSNFSVLPNCVPSLFFFTFKSISGHFWWTFRPPTSAAAAHHRQGIILKKKSKF